MASISSLNLFCVEVKDRVVKSSSAATFDVSFSWWEASTESSNLFISPCLLSTASFSVCNSFLNSASISCVIFSCRSRISLTALSVSKAKSWEVFSAFNWWSRISFFSALWASSKAAFSSSVLLLVTPRSFLKAACVSFIASMTSCLTSVQALSSLFSTSRRLFCSLCMVSSKSSTRLLAISELNFKLSLISAFNTLLASSMTVFKSSVFPLVVTRSALSAACVSFIAAMISCRISVQALSRLSSTARRLLCSLCIVLSKSSTCLEAFSEFTFKLSFSSAFSNIWESCTAVFISSMILPVITRSSLNPVCVAFITSMMSRRMSVPDFSSLSSTARRLFCSRRTVSSRSSTRLVALSELTFRLSLISVFNTQLASCMAAFKSSVILLVATSSALSASCVAFMAAMISCRISVQPLSSLSSTARRLSFSLRTMSSRSLCCTVALPRESCRSPWPLRRSESKEESCFCTDANSSLSFCSFSSSFTL
mmetsp:Transcript_114230/g.213951  ORF Transcript_114230/g.213951 Transcript_114230/m.213951 type:complete len:483 (-) Transcript_114230:1732-3180(-)